MEGCRRAAEAEADADGTQGTTAMAETIAIRNNIRLVLNEVILLLYYCDVGIPVDQCAYAVYGFVLVSRFMELQLQLRLPF